MKAQKRSDPYHFILVTITPIIAFEKDTATHCFVLKTSISPPKIKALRTLPFVSHVVHAGKAHIRIRLSLGHELAKMQNHAIIQSVSCTP